MVTRSSGSRLWLRVVRVVVMGGAVGAAPSGALLPWRLAGRAEDEILAMVTFCTILSMIHACTIMGEELLALERAGEGEGGSGSATG